MRLPLPPSNPALSREDKEAKLKAFITEALAIDGGRIDETRKTYSLVARSLASPVVKALHAATADIVAAGIAVRVVLFESEALADEPAQAALLDSSAIEIRVLNDQRFSAAHEQLTLDHGRVWIGDCMRRDPAKRDAFEMYHTGLPTMTAHAEGSFAKLWEKATVANRVLSAPVAADILFAGNPNAGKTADMPEHH